MPAVDDYTYSPGEAWSPLPDAGWDVAAARHLLRRAGWTAPPDEVERATAAGLPATLDRLFPSDPPLLPYPDVVRRFVAHQPDYRAREATATTEERIEIGRERLEEEHGALHDLALIWLAYAAQPANASYAKWVLFLSNLYVVGSDKVANPDFIYRHFDTLGRLGLGPAPALVKAVSRSPAMLLYLDLNQNKKEAPNENFARELFELFVLGEGHYTEQDIKEAARAFTGYRYRGASGRFFLDAREHDEGTKSVFGQTGPFTGDDVIDLAFGQRAASARVPHKLVEAYLSDRMLPDEYLYALGDRWRTEGGYDLRWLVRQFFGSRMFFAPEFRGDFIKSPIQFYLGMLEDLRLDVMPVQRFVLNPLRQMGQGPFYPPNVRGWVGGRHWINSSSLAARRTAVEAVFSPVDESAFTADEQGILTAARTAGKARFTVDAERLQPFAALPPAEAVARLQAEFLSAPFEPPFRTALERFIAESEPGTDERLRRIRRAAITVFESPIYQVC